MARNTHKRIADVKAKHNRGRRKKTKKIKDGNPPPPSERRNEDGLLAQTDTEEEDGYSFGEEETSGSSEEEAAAAAEGSRKSSEPEKEGSRGMYEEKEDEERYAGSSEEHYDGQESSGTENDGQQTSNRFADGSNAFRSAFSKIMGKKVSDDTLGPVLSAHKKLIAKKLDEEAGELKVKSEAKKEKRLGPVLSAHKKLIAKKLDEEAGELKVKSEAKKEKRLLREKGHVKPESFLDGKEKVLIRLATKGVVKLFNAVNKAQNVRSSQDISKSRGAKAVKKETKAAFLSELHGSTLPSSFNPAQFSSVKAHSSSVMEIKNEPQNSVSKPGWAALHDDFMLTSSKLKDWDRLPDASATGVIDEMQVVNNGSSSSDED